MDHRCYIGMFFDYENTELLSFDDLLAKNKRIKNLFNEYKFKWLLPTPLQDYFDRRKKSELIHFNYCPTCGKKIDWRALRKRASALPEGKDEVLFPITAYASTFVYN